MGLVFFILATNMVPESISEVVLGWSLIILLGIILFVNTIISMYISVKSCYSSGKSLKSRLGKLMGGKKGKKMNKVNPGSLGARSSIDSQAKNNRNSSSTLGSLPKEGGGSGDRKKSISNLDGLRIRSRSRGLGDIRGKGRIRLDNNTKRGSDFGIGSRGPRRSRVKSNLGSPELNLDESALNLKFEENFESSRPLG